MGSMKSLVLLFLFSLPLFFWQTVGAQEAACGASPVIPDGDAKAAAGEAANDASMKTLCTAQNALKTAATSITNTQLKAMSEVAQKEADSCASALNLARTACAESSSNPNAAAVKQAGGMIGPMTQSMAGNSSGMCSGLGNIAGLLNNGINAWETACSGAKTRAQSICSSATSTIQADAQKAATLCTASEEGIVSPKCLSDSQAFKSAATQLASAVKATSGGVVANYASTMTNLAQGSMGMLQQQQTDANCKKDLSNDNSAFCQKNPTHPSCLTNGGDRNTDRHDAVDGQFANAAGKTGKGNDTTATGANSAAVNGVSNAPKPAEAAAVTDPNANNFNAKSATAAGGAGIGGGSADAGGALSDADKLAAAKKEAEKKTSDAEENAGSGGKASSRKITSGWSDRLEDLKNKARNIAGQKDAVKQPLQCTEKNAAEVGCSVWGTSGGFTPWQAISRSVNKNMSEGHLLNPGDEK